MKKFFFSLCIALATLASGACTLPERAPELVVGMNNDEPPFAYREEGSKELIGIDVDLSNKIAENLGRRLVIKEMAFNDLPSALAAGDVDAIVSAFSIAEKRGLKMDFSFPYHSVVQVVLVSKDVPVKISSQEDLAGKKIGVIKATTHEDTALKVTKNGNVIIFDNYIALLNDLRAGKIEAAIVDEPYAYTVVEKYNDVLMIDLTFEDELYSIAVNKGNMALLQDINAVLKKLKKSGELAEIFKKYKHKTK